jgi:hypothetical protein
MENDFPSREELDSQFAAESFTAERVELYVRQSLGQYPGMAKNVKFESYASTNIEQMIFMLKTWCICGRIEDNHVTRTVAFPDGTWQMFKLRWMPSWFLHLFPVRNIEQKFTITTNHYFVCPHLVTDDRHAHIQFMATGTRFAGMMGGRR